MCGIVGGWWSTVPSNLDSCVESALLAMRERGPDDRRYQVNRISQGVLVLGHTRLSIIDLSPSGGQPMTSPDGRFTMVFNGEIYNYRELRHELLANGRAFVSASDTEVLLQAWAVWGVGCLRRLVGMFSFAVLDRQSNELTCARDAFGIKPFFYSLNDGRFLFASEQGALRTLMSEQPKADWQRCYDYLVPGDYDSQERTFVYGVKHLLPAHFLKFTIDSGEFRPPQRWWAPNIKETSTLTFGQATEAVREQFLDNVRLHMRSDVPIGAALSGGIDSSAVVCSMRYLYPDRPIHTFSFVARGHSVSEERWIDRVNGHVGAISHKLEATWTELARDIDDLIRSQGEPFGGTSVYGQYRIFQLAKNSGIAVTLDGQGADELLAGYIGYPGFRVLSLLDLGHPLSAICFARYWSQWPGRSPRRPWEQLVEILLPDVMEHLPDRWLGRNSEPTWLKSELMREAGVRMRRPRSLMLRSHRGRRVAAAQSRALTHMGLISLLRHADRASMRFSVESRVPFLTLPMADLLLQLPERYLISDKGETKSVFRAAMRGIVPDDILDRRDKIGFGTPERSWMMRLAPTAREWLRASEPIPFIDRDELLKRFDTVVAGKAPFDWQVWCWVNFVKWYEQVGFGR
jgi:asparagine synthase (glutamine-hydrolysing)